MLRKEWFRPKKMRVLLAWIGVPFLIFYSEMTDFSYRWGGILIGVGEIIRLWALGFVERKGKKLAMRGPYAFTRNPLYVGNFFLGLGVVTIVANWYFLAVFLAGFAYIYLKTIRNEEKDLLATFGKPYADYCAEVPAVFPRLTPYKAPEPDSFDWRRILKHHEYVTGLGIALMLCCIHLYDELFVEKDPIESQLALIVITAVLAVALIAERIFVSDFKTKFAQGMPNLFLKKRNKSLTPKPEKKYNPPR